MSLGRLDIVGIGPGPLEWMTPGARSIIEDATDLVGYGGYLDRLAASSHQNRHASDNRVELDRARVALDLALAGARVALVSSGDPGIFAMAAAVFEAVETGDPRWRALAIEVHPGVSAMLAAAARLGAPLGHDFAVISLSDNLKPWSAIERRLEAAAGADSVIALYNPASKTRPHVIYEAFALLRRLRSEETIVAFARAVGRPDERIQLTTLAAAEPSRADMSTLILIGSSQTRRVERADGGCWVYTPRSYGAAL
ncbi:MAG TPA: precorrin-3B C(17)-methyltransferase [Roseiarcus sp.]|nr:precorrin-3B C(17)-methyltransferase [Roseiarcus sp.]